MLVFERTNDAWSRGSDSSTGSAHHRYWSCQMGSTALYKEAGSHTVTGLRSCAVGDCVGVEVRVGLLDGITSERNKAVECFQVRSFLTIENLVDDKTFLKFRDDVLASGGLRSYTLNWSDKNAWG
jgi:hypothetical protein